MNALLYWSRSGSYIDLALFLVQCLAWSFGGWLIVRSLFALKPRERWVCGIATGLLLFITLSDLLTPLVHVPGSFWAATGLVFGAGILLGYARRRVWRPLREDLAGWPLLVGWFLITAIFTLVLRGLGLFDDYLHLPLVAVMGRGDIPPHFYLDPSLHFAYHYGLHVLAAAGVSSGGMFPWSAWDASRAVAFGLAAVLAWVWMRRVTGSRLGAWLGAILASLGGGTRWLLLALPSAWIDRMAAGLDLQPTALLAGRTLGQALRGTLSFQGGGPVPFPFAFTNTNYAPLDYHLGSSGALPNVAILVLLLLAGSRRVNLRSSLVLGILLSGLALSAEHIFIPLSIGISVVLLVGRFRTTSPRTSRGWSEQPTVALLVGLSLALVQGGYVTQAAGGFLDLALRALSNVGLTFPGFLPATLPASTGGHFLAGFVPRWPPALFSGHLGTMSLFVPGQVVILLAELGPAIAFAPFVSMYYYRARRARSWLLTSLAMAAAISLVAAFFFRYGVDRQTTRLSDAALWMWTVVGFPLAWRWCQHRSLQVRLLGSIAYGATVIGGVVLLVVELLAIQRPQLSYFITYGDAQISRRFWDHIGPNALVFDPMPERAVTLFGWPVSARTDIYPDSQSTLPEWARLDASPDPHVLRKAGYAYLYVDQAWWSRLTPSLQDAIGASCVDEVAYVEFGVLGEWRQLLDITRCG